VGAVRDLDKMEAVAELEEFDMSRRALAPARVHSGVAQFFFNSMHADSVLTSVYLARSFTPMVCELNSFASVHAFCDEARALSAAAFFCAALTLGHAAGELRVRTPSSPVAGELLSPSARWRQRSEKLPLRVCVLCTPVLRLRELGEFAGTMRVNSGRPTLNSWTRSSPASP
jgi:hypothetical protein